MEISDHITSNNHKYNTRSKKSNKRKNYKEESSDDDFDDFDNIENIKQKNKIIINDNSNSILKIRKKHLHKLLNKKKKLKINNLTIQVLNDEDEINQKNNKTHKKKSKHQDFVILNSENESEDESEHESEDESEQGDTANPFEEPESEDRSEDGSEDQSEDEYKDGSEQGDPAIPIEESESENESENESNKQLIQDNKTFEHESEKFLNNEINKLLRKKNKKSNNLLNDLVIIANKLKKHDKLEKKKKYKEKFNKNLQIFKELCQEKDNLNDIKYFKEKLEIKQQKYLIDELYKINKESTIEKPYKIILLESNIPIKFKIVALKKIKIMENMDSSVSEYFKLKNWIDTFMQIPFNKYSELPVKFDDGLSEINIFMENAMKILNDAVYGLEDAKMQIMQLIGQWIVNPNAIGSSFSLKGPMGTGKTTLVQHGISKILNRPFHLIPLGGATEAAFLEGHGYTYEGSTYGKIVDILIQSKCSNPVIYFDELDKVSDTPKGEEIINILTHLIDSTQNTNFQDKYFSEIYFNLSKALFVFSYNDENRINPILRDRMYKISTKGYNTNEKKIIAKNYLIPYICKQVNIKNNEVIISDDLIIYIIKNYTENEAGVRNLKRCFEIIFTKINLFRLMKPESNLFDKEKCLKIEFPFNVTEKIIDKIVPQQNTENDNWKKMYL